MNCHARPNALIIYVASSQKLCSFALRCLSQRHARSTSDFIKKPLVLIALLLRQGKHRNNRSKQIQILQTLARQHLETKIQRPKNRSPHRARTRLPSLRHGRNSIPIPSQPAIQDPRHWMCQRHRNMRFL